MTRQPDSRQPTGDGLGCLVCYFLLMGVLALPVVLVNAPALLRPPPPAADPDAVESELATFARAVCPEVQVEIETLTERERDEWQRLQALAELLEKLGRKPADDHDHAAWSRELDATTVRLTTARRSREEQFLQARKAALTRP